MGMFSNIRNSMTMAKNVVREFEEQARQHAGQPGVSGQQPGAPFGSVAPPSPPPPAPAGFGPAPHGQPFAPHGQPFGSGQPFASGHPLGPGPQQPRPMFTDLDMLGMSSSFDGAPRRRDPRRIIYLLTALVLTAFGAWMLVVGILDIVHDGTKIRATAVADGIVSSPSAPSGEVSFVSAATGSYSVFIDLDTSSEDVRDDVVASVSCLARFADGDVATFVGNRQGASSTYGDLSTIGVFTAPEGQVSISCGRSNERSFGDVIRFYVTPGKPNLLGSIVKIFGGAGLLAVALVFTIAGFRRPKYVGGRNYPTIVA